MKYFITLNKGNNYKKVVLTKLNLTLDSTEKEIIKKILKKLNCSFCIMINRDNIYGFIKDPIQCDLLFSPWKKEVFLLLQ